MRQPTLLVILLLLSAVFISSCGRKTTSAAEERTAVSAAPQTMEPPSPAQNSLPKETYPVQDLEEITNPRPGQAAPAVIKPVEEGVLLKGPVRVEESGAGRRPNPAVERARAERERQKELQREAQEKGMVLTSDGKMIEAPDVVFEVRTTPCYKGCEQYRFQVLDNGEYLYLGERNVRNIGSFETKPLQYQYDELVQAFQDFVAEDPAALYPTEGEPPADVAATVVAYTDAEGNDRKVTVFYDGPEGFDALTEAVKQAIGKGQWRKSQRRIGKN